MKKRVLCLVILVIVLCNIVIAPTDQESAESGVKESEVTDAVNNNQPFQGVTNSHISPSTSSGDVSIPSGSTVSVNNGDLTSSNIDVAETKSGVIIRNSLETTISKNGNVALSSADSVKIGSITITNVKNLKYNDEIKSLLFDSAQKLVESQRMISLDNLKESRINVKDNIINKLSVQTDTKQSFRSLLIDGFVETTASKDGSFSIDLSNYKENQVGSKITYEITKSNLIIKSPQQKPILTAQPAKDTEIVEITKADFGFITRAENSIITISTDQLDERFVGNETYFEWNLLDGINNAVLESPGAYRYIFKELQIDRNGIFGKANKTFAQSYEVSRRENLPKYELLIDKHSKRVQIADFSVNSNNAYLSLINHLIKLNGIVTYSRINFDLKTTPRFMGGSWWVEVLPADGSFLPILEFFTDNQAIINLDSNNIHANISIKPNFAVGKSYTAYFDDLAISETPNGLLRSWTTSPFIIDELSSSNNIKFKNLPAWAVTQFENNISTVSFYSKQDKQLNIFNKEIADYADLSCDSLNEKLTITQEVINTIRGLLQ